MINLINTGINKFSKRQMTFFRRMEKRGVKIKWINNDDLSIAKKYIKDFL